MVEDRSRFGEEAKPHNVVKDDAPRPGQSGALAVAAAGTLLTLVAFTVPLTTLAGTAAELQAGPGAQAWVLSAMSLGSAVGLLASGALGDAYGRCRIFLTGALVLAASSLVGALAPDALVLILARVAQGLGGAALLACGLGLIGHAFPDAPARARATGVWGAALGAGVALGPILAAGLAAVGGWRLPYAATVLAAASLAIAGRALLAESRASRPGRVDAAGALVLGLGIAAVLAGLVEGRAGWGHPLVLALLGAGLALLAGFVIVERRAAHPLLDLALLRRPDFVGATLAALAAGAGVLALSTVVPTLIERGLGGGALLAAVVLLAWSATSALTAWGARWLPPWLSPRARLVVGLAGCAAGQLALAGLAPGSPVVRLLPGLVVAGAANGVLNAALGFQATATVPADRAAMGAGANNTARYVGSALGIAVVAVLVTRAGVAGAAGVVAGWNAAALLTAGVSLLGALLVALAREQSATTEPSRRPAVPARATRLRKVPRRSLHTRRMRSL